MDPLLQKLPDFLYESNLILEGTILVILLLSLIKPHFFAVALLGINLIRPNERFSNMTISFAFVSFVLLVVALLLHYRKTETYSFEKEDKVLIALVGFILLLTLLFHMGNIFRNFMICGLGLLSYFGYTRLASGEKGLKIFNYALLVFFLIICLEPLYYNMTESYDSLLWNTFHTYNRLNAWGIWKNANETAFLASFGVGTALMLYIRERRFSSFLCILVSLPIFLYTIYLTKSRAGMGALAVIVVVSAFLSKSKVMKFAGIVILIAAIVYVPGALSQRRDAEMEASSDERADLRYIGRQLFKEYPLRGVGFYRASEDATNVLHNTYVQAFAELGIIGGGIFLYYLYLVLAKLIKRFWSNMKRGGEDSWLRDNLGLLLGLWMSGLFYLYFGNQLLTPIFFSLAAFVKISYGVLAARGNTRSGQDNITPVGKSPPAIQG